MNDTDDVIHFARNLLKKKGDAGDADDSYHDGEIDTLSLRTHHVGRTQSPSHAKTMEGIEEEFDLKDISGVENGEN